MSTDRENDIRKSNEPIIDPQKNEITSEAAGECQEESADMTQFKVADEIKNEGADEPQSKPRNNTVLWIFSAAIVVVCFVLFLFCYKWAYRDGGIIPPSFGVKVYHFYVVIVAIFVAIALKAVFEKRVRLWTLLVASVLLPVLCYQVNYHTLKKDSIFFPLVDEGGIFHFIVIGDYDFDGMNDEWHHRLYEERTVTSMCADNGDVVRNMNAKLRGVGQSLDNCFFTYDEEKNNRMKFHLYTTVELKYVELVVSFYDPDTAQKISFYEVTEDGEVKIEHTINKEGKAVIYFDAETCAEYQSRCEEGKTLVEIMFRFEVEE